MCKLSLSLVLLAAAPVFGQLESHTLTISAARSIAMLPDQALLGLSVISPVTTNLDPIVAALSGLGITSANFTGVGSSTVPPSVQWNFTLAVPLSNVTGIIGSITKLEQTIAQNNSGLMLTFGINGTQASQTSQQLQQSQSCANSDLIADAMAQAQKLAAAAGLSLGPILKLSNTPLIQPVPETARLVGYVVPVEVFSTFLLAGATPPVACSLVVQFQLLP